MYTVYQITFQQIFCIPYNWISTRTNSCCGWSTTQVEGLLAKRLGKSSYPCWLHQAATWPESLAANDCSLVTWCESHISPKENNVTRRESYIGEIGWHDVKAVSVAKNMSTVRVVIISERFLAGADQPRLIFGIEADPSPTRRSRGTFPRSQLA